MLKSIASQVWRAGGATLISGGISGFLATPWGMILLPVLMGASKGLKKYYEVNNLPIPTWVAWLPF